MTEQQNGGLTRRHLLGGMGAGVLGLGLIRPIDAATLPEPEESEIFDVVVLGSGLAGCSAALEAAERGARVALIEKAPSSEIGGNSIKSAAFFAIPATEGAAGENAYVAEFERLTENRGNSTIFGLMAAHAREGLAWLGGQGVETLAFPAGPDAPIGLALAVGGMTPLFNAFRQRFAERGITLDFDTKARQLIVDAAGAVVGVRAVGPEGAAVDYRARAVVIAAGGYSGNRALLDAYTHPDAWALKASGIPWASGDGLLLAQAAGAGLVGMGGVDGVLPVPADPTEPTGGLPFQSLEHTVAINLEGRRFTNEALGYPFIGPAVFNQPGHQAALVFDETARLNPAVAGGIATFRQYGISIVSADTLEELAEQIGAPAQTLTETINAFNAAIVGGAAPGANPPKTAFAHPVATGPYHAFFPIVGSILLTFGGIAIDARARVLEPDGRVIPGLYAAGENAGGVFRKGYTTGGSLCNCLVMGRIAGREAAGV